ncbi:MAG: hypothetical protein HRT88_20485 [Lentisphaeraceae bacterium]|nr:hypothetical protein [Lentisphaeraceae bacterium]
MDYFNLSAECNGNGDLATVMNKASANFLIMSFSSDWLFPPYQSVEIVKALQSCQKEVTYCNIESDYVHDAFLLEFETLGDIVRSFLTRQGKLYKK